MSSISRTSSAAIPGSSPTTHAQPPPWEPSEGYPGWVVQERATAARQGHTPIEPSRIARLTHNYGGLLIPLGAAGLGIWGGLHISAGAAIIVKVVVCGVCAGLAGVGGMVAFSLAAPLITGSVSLKKRYQFHEYLDLHYATQRSMVKEALWEGAVLGAIGGFALAAAATTAAGCCAGPVAGILAGLATWAACIVLGAGLNAWMAYNSAFERG